MKTGRGNPMSPLLRVLRTALLALAAGVLPATAQAAGAPAWLRVEQQVLIAPAAVDGLRPLELSALAWDEVAGELVAVSDRGALFRFQAHDSDGQLVALPRSAHRIEQGRNAEALHGDGEGGLWLLTETAGKAMRLGHQGQRLDSRPWPLRREKGAGAEALAWQLGVGLLVALQGPQRSAGLGGTRRLHAVHADGGRRWAFEPAGAGSHVKAIEALPDGRLLVLERVPRGAAADGSRLFRTVLRLLDLRACGQAEPCDAAVLPVSPPLPVGPENFEGLACASDGRCWIVNDSGPEPGTPTRLLQLRLELR